MNKNEQNRVVAWRLKLLRQASDMPRSVAQTCRHFGLSRKAFYIYGLLPICNSDLRFNRADDAYIYSATSANPQSARTGEPHAHAFTNGRPRIWPSLNVTGLPGASFGRTTSGLGI